MSVASVVWLISSSNGKSCKSEISKRKIVCCALDVKLHLTWQSAPAKVIECYFTSRTTCLFIWRVCFRQIQKTTTLEWLWLMVLFFYPHQPVTEPLPSKPCWVLRLSALVPDCSETLYKDITAESSKRRPQVNCWFKVRKNLLFAPR